MSLVDGARAVRGDLSEKKPRVVGDENQPRRQGAA